MYLKYSKILLIVFIASTFGCSFIFESRHAKREFDSETWKNWEETTSTAGFRFQMIHSLKSKHELVGKSRGEIINLLGEPESKQSFSFCYFLGMSGWGINTGSLTIEFSQNGLSKTISVWEG